MLCYAMLCYTILYYAIIWERIHWAMMQYSLSRGYEEIAFTEARLMQFLEY